MLSAFIVSAQTKITGKVTSSDDQQPVIGASVTLKGTSTGAVTGTDGTFTLMANTGDVLTITYLGYVTREINIGSQTNYNIVLNPSANDLNEVVVTGYSSQRKKDITGSVSVVNVKDLKAVPAGSPEQMLQGRAAGLNIITSGNPGSGSNVRIRGITSFGNTDPLVMVDGVQGSLTNLNSNDIESIQVLKDAGAAAVYGVRGSNGVIVVTTKKGSGKPTITYDAYYGTQLPLKEGFPLLKPQEMADLTWLSYRNSGQVNAVTGNPEHPQYGSGIDPVLPDYILPSGAKEGDPSVNPALYNIDFTKPSYQIVKANKEGTDWFHEIFNPAPIQSHSVTASGGSDQSSYLFSGAYFNQQGTLLNTYLKRYSARINTQFNVKDKIRIGENLFVFNRDNPQIGNQGEGNEISNAYRTQPIVPVYDINGNFGGGAGARLGQGTNPVAARTRVKDNKGNQWDVQGNVFLETDLFKKVVARTSFGGVLNLGYNYGFGFRTYENAENIGQNNYTENSSYNRNYTWTNSLTYSDTFAEKHVLKVFAATEAVDYYGRGVGGQRFNLFSNDPNFRNLSNGSPTGQTNYSYAYQNSLFSLIGRLDYQFNDKYLFSATIRRDGSSVFGPESRYGIFPSVTAGWRISNEPFMKGISWINDMKIRGGYGILGAQANVNPTNAFTLFGGSPGGSYYDINGVNNSSIIGFNAASIGNPATSWEENKIGNLGFDATLFNNKFDISVELYKKSIKGLLFALPLPATVGGASRPTVNVGNVENKGIDLTTNYRGKVNSDFSYDLGVILTTYNSNITNIPGDYFDAGGTRIGNFARNQIGNPIGAFYGYEVAGIFQNAAEVTASPTQDAAAPGRFKYRDVDGSGTITDKDRTFFGNPNPDFTYGLNLGASYKSFDFSTFLYGSQGNDVINYVRWWTDFFPSFQGAKSKDALYNSWSTTNTSGTTPIAENNSNFSNNGVPNSYYKEDGSYLRLKSLILGYTLKPALLNRYGINRLRIYAQGANLFTITKYTGLDPELSGNNTSFGIDYGNYPNSQPNYNFGIQATF
ncbi:MAG: TonB-dependent receptor [Flavobacterium sp.]|nr:TonB-dependent receptor [Pedobacter sp.]